MNRDTGAERLPFLVLLASGLLAVVLAGFAPTFYLRGDGLPALSRVLVAHGVFLTAWYLLFLVQAALLGGSRGASRLRLHRWFGYSGVLIVLGAVVSGAAVAVGFFRRGTGDGVFEPAAILFGNFANLASLLICYACGLALRRTKPFHERFMAVAGIVMIGPAAFRLALNLGLPPLVSLAVHLAFLAALFVHDLLRLKRVHAVSWIGLGLVGAQVVGTLTVGASGAWARLTEAAFGAG